MLNDESCRPNSPHVKYTDVCLKEKNGGRRREKSDGFELGPEPGTSHTTGSTGMSWIVF